ncbi:putative baseplate assembly protein [Actinophytocola glycyrrhizae]|uniref:Baseplate assembly protein n=1 Tax=Actinophytocola glycyrrhizae TaxID=2044873 RepID=A0ABV9SCF4_9PSEU
MALPAPDLDDRGYDDLVDDALRLVRLRCPEWTDHNPSDPGITLIETFAYLTDALLDRLNRVPDRLHLKFLDLIGLRLRPPTPARTPLTFWFSSPATASLTVPAGTQAGTVRGEGVEPVVFSTTEDATAPPCAVAGLRTRADGESAVVEGPIPVFSGPPAVGDELLVGLVDPAPGCAVRFDVVAHVDGLGVDPRHPPLRWQARTDDGWTDCEVEEDGTGGLNRPGALVLHVPAGHRRTLEHGTLAAWLRAVVVAPADGRPAYTAPPVLSELTASTVGVTAPAVHAEIVDHEELGTADGSAGRALRLGSAPVLGDLGDAADLGGGVVVETSSEDGWQEWQQVDDFAGSGPGDRHFALDAVLGEVRFGPVLRLADGTVAQHGAVPPRGAAIRVRRYATGGGTRGNVAAGTVTALRSSVPFVSAVENRRSAQGGTDAETVDEARDRAPVLLRTRDRAVTAEDYEALAIRAVPGLARVRCAPSGVDGTPAGTVKVLVVPAAAEVDGKVRFADLVPDERTLRAVAERLDAVRTVGTRVLVEPPRYRGLTVVARLVARPRTDPAAVENAAVSALYRMFSPLPGGGPDGAGWPFGRAVRTGDVYALLHRVRGVEYVEDVRLFSANPVSGERGGEQPSIEVSRHSLVFSFDHQVRVETEER